MFVICCEGEGDHDGDAEVGDEEVENESDEEEGGDSVHRKRLQRRGRNQW